MQKIFSTIMVSNIVSWNALITGYIDHEYDEEALMCFETMQLEYISPDIITFSCILKAGGNIRAISKGREIRDHIATIVLLKKHQEFGITVINMYMKCESLGTAQ